MFFNQTVYEFSLSHVFKRPNNILSNYDHKTWPSQLCNILPSPCSNWVVVIVFIVHVSNPFPFINQLQRQVSDVIVARRTLFSVGVCDVFCFRSSWWTPWLVGLGFFVRGKGTIFFSPL
jgi:hypothetical protein